VERRWRLLEDEPALVSPEWLPPAEECEQLADLRAEHERLLAVNNEAQDAVADLYHERNTQLEAQRAAQEQAFLTGAHVDVPELTVTGDELAEAGARAEAARDALQAFVGRAVETIREREPEIVDVLTDVLQQAEAKRARAQELLAEADAMEAKPWRLSRWLDRVAGRSALGHVPYSELAAPPPPEPLDMEAALAGGGFTEVEVTA
jgi:hypothetical protein